TERGHLCPQVIFPCADGFISWRVFVGPQGNKTRALVKWMEAEGKAGSLADVDWAKVDMNAVTQPELEAWEKGFADFFMQYPKKRLSEEASKSGIMLFPVNTVAEIRDAAQLKSRDFWEKVEHPELGTSITYPGAPFKVEGPQWRMSRRAPLIGEHNDEIYCGELGLSRSDLDGLRSRNVI
ncbi:MAG: CoA transferase, partial [Sterolibacterium sp.]